MRLTGSLTATLTALLVAAGVSIAQQGSEPPPPRTVDPNVKYDAPKEYVLESAVPLGRPILVHLHIDRLACLKQQERGGDEIFFRSFGARTPSAEVITMSVDKNPTLTNQLLWYVRMKPGEVAETIVEVWEHDPSLIDNGANDDLIGKVRVKVLYQEDRLKATWSVESNAKTLSPVSNRTAFFELTGSGAHYQMEVSQEVAEDKTDPSAYARQPGAPSGPRRKGGPGGGPGGPGGGRRPGGPPPGISGP